LSFQKVVRLFKKKKRGMELEEVKKKIFFFARVLAKGESQRREVVLKEGVWLPTTGTEPELVLFDVWGRSHVLCFLKPFLTPCCCDRQLVSLRRAGLRDDGEGGRV
jgi:hypothetical protein